MLKLNRLLYCASDEDVFINHIEPTQYQRDVLFAAKNDIRDYLRPRIRAATLELLGMAAAVTPRFRTQGSWKYKTCVQPAWNPPQEMDWDFGVYLPVTVWVEGGPPHEMAKLYFDLVERLLMGLCKEKGWTLFTGKDTCIRVQLSHWAHIDLPLYAAPEEQFVQIVDKAARAASQTLDAHEPLVANFDDAEFGQQLWEEMTDIRIATRTGEWKKSDPEALSRWFLDRVAEHPDQLRRVCRYLKAWRDLHWKDGDGPTSVCIMIAVAQAFAAHPGRDDLALEGAARTLAKAFKGDVREPGIDGGVEDFNQRLDAEERGDAANKAELLADALRTARFKATFLVGDAIAILKAQLGDRVPNRPDLVDPDGGEDAVRLAGAERVSRPVVRATSAG